MAVADTKELAQCMAFAYFAENPNYREKDHDVKFYELFSGKENVSKYKAKYLSNQFPIDTVKKEFIVKKTATGKTSYNETTKKVYKVALTCIEKGMLKYNLNEYEFLDQNDPFVLLIKDTSLGNIKKAFDLSYKADALSAVDVFFVKKTSKQNIMKEFVKLFSDKDTILANAVWGTKNDYTSITEKYMDSGEMYPVSLKLPKTISGTVHVKRIQMHGIGESKIEVDPFIKFLAAILNDPSKTKDYIEKMVVIHYDKFSTGELLNWVFPVTFDYKSIIEPVTKQPMSKYNLNFNLFGQGYGAGWNGQFDASTKEHQAIQWVGGVSSTTFSIFAEQYPEYRRVVDEMSKLRATVFEDFCKDIDTKHAKLTDGFLPAKQSARAELVSHKILITSTLKKTMAFFTTIQDKVPREPNEISLMAQYELKYIDAVRGYHSPYKGNVEKQQDVIYAHFVHAQLGYFLFAGGKKMHSYFKQRLFMTIFGLITKKSHLIIGDDDYPAMRNIIQKEVVKGQDKFKSEFSTAPHFLIS
jgi:hypothetical protein